LTRYFDASALAKRYVRETGSATVRRLLASGSAATSRLSVVEVSSAIVRRAREGAFTIDERDRMLAALQHDVPALAMVELTPEITADARTVLLRYPLRAGDAVQLASAVYLQRQLARPVPFVAYDRRLVLAARAEGLVVTGARGGPQRDVPKAMRIVKQVDIGNPAAPGDTVPTNVIRRPRTRKPRRPRKG
jgi:predicted nucleic acid-binding protein